MIRETVIRNILREITCVGPLSSRQKNEGNSTSFSSFFSFLLAISVSFSSFFPPRSISRHFGSNDEGVKGSGKGGEAVRGGGGSIFGKGKLQNDILLLLLPTGIREISRFCSKIGLLKRGIVLVFLFFAMCFSHSRPNGSGLKIKMFSPPFYTRLSFFFSRK